MASMPFFIQQTFLFFLTFLIFSLDTSLADPLSATSYSQHCGTNESQPTKLLFSASNAFSISNGVFFGGGQLNNFLFPPPRKGINRFFDTTMPNLFYFQPTQVHLTRDKGILKLEGTLVLQGAYVRIESKSHPQQYHHERRKVIFKLSGLWSQATGKLCMVGLGEYQPSDEDHIADARSAVLKLDFPKTSNITTSVINGTVTSTALGSSPAYFDPISLQAYEQKAYEDTITVHARESCADLPDTGSVAIEGESICANLESFMRGESFSSRELVSLLGFEYISISQLKCSSSGSVHMLMALSNQGAYFHRNTPLQPGKSLVAEGVWDDQKHRLCLLACKLIWEENHSSARPKIGDCNIGLAIWFTSTYSLRNRSVMIGQIWNTSNGGNNHGHRKVFPLYSKANDLYLVVPGSKYVYTQLDTAKMHCNIISNPNHKIKKRYADASLHRDMNFQLNVQDSNGKSAWGMIEQVSVDETYHGNRYGGFFQSVNRDTYSINGASLSRQANQNRTIWNVGYALRYTFWSKQFRESVQISAEGIYHSTTGTLCLVGCRLPTFKLMRNGTIVEDGNSTIDDENLDCKIFIQIQLPPQDAENEKGTGTIKSMRASSDPLYFKPLKVEFSIFDGFLSTETFARMGAEIVMVIISLTLLCACAYLQLRHVRNHSKLLPMMSITMLVVLNMGCMVSLILNIEAVLLPAQKRQPRFESFESGSWFNISNTANAIVRSITLVALLIHVRLLQSAWCSRSKEENTKDISCDAEKKSLMLCVPLYFSGVLIVWFVHSWFSEFDHTIMEDLTCYVGLMVDNFLLPQIIFNIFSQSQDKALTPFFYAGATLVRAVPHIYNTYRSWRYIRNISWSDIYANPSEDYYSQLLDVAIPVMGVVFVVLVYMQQRFGGRCFLPKKFKRDVSYELVSASNN